MNKLLFDNLEQYNIGNFGNKGFFGKKLSTDPVDFSNILSKYVSNFAVKDFDSKLKKRNLLLFLVTGLISFIVILVRLSNIQIIHSGYYNSMAANNKTRHAVLIPERGVIYSSDKKILARNSPSFVVEMNTFACGNSLCKSVASRLAELIPDKIDIKKLEANIDSRAPLIIAASNLEKESALKVEANLYQLPGISVAVYPKRDYVYPEVLSHVLGYVGFDDVNLTPKIVGKTGVEEAYNAYLTGIAGNIISEVDSTGLKYNVVAREDSLPGRNISVWLNAELSQKAYEVLKKIVDDKKATGGVVVAQDPSTGGILAMVSYPTFDANKMSSGMSFNDYQKLINDPAHPFFNRAISAAYPPGSTFKMVPASAALTEGIVTQHTTVNDPGYIQVGSYIFRNWKLSGHGEVDILRALQVSNDTYFYTLGGGHAGIKGLGIEKLHAWANKFGYGEKTGIDISGEVAGNMPDGEARAWYLGDTFITAIGQGDVLATPLQVNNVTNYFANGGYLYSPRIVKEIEGVKPPEPGILASNLTSKSTYDIVREGMRRAVSPGGTGYPVFDFPQKKSVVLAGKTGTSEYINSEGKPATHAWFTVFGPFEKPTISLTVFLEGGGAGSDDAGPVARQLLDVWFK